jgi:hypothetical protein
MKTIATAVLAAGLGLTACSSGGGDNAANTAEINATLGAENLDAGLEADLNATDLNATADLNAGDANAATNTDAGNAAAATTNNSL